MVQHTGIIAEVVGSVISGLAIDAIVAIVVIVVHAVAIIVARLVVVGIGRFLNIINVSRK